jgi:hypothetical protein
MLAVGEAVPDHRDVVAGGEQGDLAAVQIGDRLAVRSMDDDISVQVRPHEASLPLRRRTSIASTVA